MNFDVSAEVTESTGTLTAGASWWPTHGLNDTFPIGTLRGMIADVGWTDEDLRRLELAE
ncbi:MAG TPA: hypothetical protein VNY24_19230 [Candidatus Acidoferrales bacterium]|nr:hypothetical protein [Candidatus Acidoferrales bacterium]